jgi:glycosyltransferase involved in cell wall biosynthesis
MSLSPIICSRNRAGKLERCLRTIRPEEMLKVAGELILVDNDSTDNTREVMVSYRDAAPFPVKVIMEPARGLWLARNSGFADAAGEVVVFTDDDCYLTDGYLLKAGRVFETGQFQYCGGRAMRYDPGDSLYSCNEDETFEIFPPRSFIPAGKIQGANFIVHRQVLQKVGRFDPWFGAGTPFRCEDIDYCARASIAGLCAGLDRLPTIISASRARN